MKDGLFYENGELIYYVNGNPKHAGVIKSGKDIYYISSGGRAVKGEHIVHGEMTNGIIKRGTYTFGEDYKLVKGSRVAPKRKKKAKTRKPLTKKQKMWISIVSGALLVAVLVFAVYENKNYVHHIGEINSGEDAATETAKNYGITLPEFDGKVLLCSQAAKDLYDGKTDIISAIVTGKPYRPMRFEYKLERGTAELLVSEKKDMSDSRKFVLNSGMDYIDIDNLKTGTHYYYTVIVGEKQYTGEFETEESTRFVTIPGTVNTRDIGGYYNLDGKKVKQGLLIRGVEIDGLVEAPYYIPNKYIEGVQDTFGFVYDFDLRQESIYTGDYKSKLGENVGHRFYNSYQYGGIFNELARDNLRQIFSDLADPDKYPMYFHCTYGTDRTGTIIYLLQGLLNMSAEDMEREYKLTGFWSRTVAESHNIEVIEVGMNAYEGDTLQEKIETFMTDFVGVTDDEIESIREIFLED